MGGYIAASHQRKDKMLLWPNLKERRSEFDTDNEPPRQMAASWRGEIDKANHSPHFPLHVWDIDNCTANDGWRLDMIDMSLPDSDEKYDAYHAAAMNDMPASDKDFSTIKPIVDGKTLNVFFTQRPEKYIQQTKIWLREKLGIADPIVFCRPADRIESSVDLKRDMLRALNFHGNRWPDLAVDDRPDVCQMYLEMGVPLVKRVAIKADHIMCHHVSSVEKELVLDVEAFMKVTGPRQIDAEDESILTPSEAREKFNLQPPMKSKFRKITLYRDDSTTQVVYDKVKHFFWNADNTVLVIACVSDEETGAHYYVHWPRERFCWFKDQP